MMKESELSHQMLERIEEDLEISKELNPDLKAIWLALGI